VKNRGVLGVIESNSWSSGHDGYIYIWLYEVMWYCHIFHSPYILYILYFSFFAHYFSHHHCPARATVATRAPLGNSYEFFSCIRDRNELQLTKYKLYRFATSNHRQQYSPHTQGSRKCFTLCIYKRYNINLRSWNTQSFGKTMLLVFLVFSPNLIFLHILMMSLCFYFLVQAFD